MGVVTQVERRRSVLLPCGWHNACSDGRRQQTEIIELNEGTHANMRKGDEENECEIGTMVCFFQMLNVRNTQTKDTTYPNYHTSIQVFKYQRGYTNHGRLVARTTKYCTVATIFSSSIAVFSPLTYENVYQSACAQQKETG